ncbi:hypothetical protein O181_028636 [Austropuccinia psidii MF-1]|uniref:Uncharacterized protein n=1 Tax=Austropuccinia psidii MF-1 TaxID=1389203 RepID=A0A9Q3H2K1_9BASI|nr:hypothetical protein [Austropuccinia psidii MF-1]
MCIEIHLQSKDLFEVCEEELPADAAIPATNKWNETSFEAISSITSRINETLFVEFMTKKKKQKAYLLWQEINNQYASQTIVNKGHIWMEWEALMYPVKLQD